VINLVPEIVTGEGDMVPRQRRNLGESSIGDDGVLLAYEADGTAQVDGVPQDDCVDDEVEAR
jgi:hypothetical protein